MRLTLRYIWLLLALMPLSAFAQEEEDTSPYSSAVLIAEQDAIQPGVPFTLGLHMRMDPGWHSYWQNPGDSGEATEIEWALPAGFTTGPMQWPFPESIDVPPLRSYGYSDEVLLMTEITPPADVQPGTSVELSGIAYWLICEEICLPAEEAISLTLPVREAADDVAANASHFEEAHANLPVKDFNWFVAATRNTGSYVLQITPPGTFTDSLEALYFFSAENTAIEHAAPQPLTRNGDTYLLAMQQSEYATGPANRLQGVLVADAQAFGAGARALAVDVLVQDARDIAAGIPEGTTPDGSSNQSLLGWLALALGGGLLLNLMPCVFPILSLKVLGFAEQSEAAASSIRKQGWWFGLGVLVSFWILAGLLLGLRAAGSQIGWGFQLQSPLFVAAMASLFFVIGLNLMGVFEIGLFTSRIGAKAHGESGQRAFMDGVLATLVATPCTAPFMGAALGAAIVLPTAQALLIFTALGAGMALPYVLLANMPALVHKLPKPGAWMETLKQVLAFPMLATTIWLVWVFGNQTSVDGAALLLLGMLLIGAACWILGRWPAIQISTATRLTSRAIAIALAVLAFTSVYAGTQFLPAAGAATGASSNATSDSVWQPFSQARVDALQAAGTPVFIDFTATWCITCQVNKRTTLNNKPVLDAFAQKGVTLFQADWTNEDPEITAALEKHGRSGVPMYVLDAGDGSSPILLPEILTESIVLEALANLPNATNESD